MGKERVIRINAKLVPVSEEVFKAYHSIENRCKYLNKKDLRHGVVFYGNMDTDEMTGEETIPDLQAESVEDITVNKLMAEKLHDCLNMLSDSEQELIHALFFEGKSERLLSAETGVLQQTINYRKKLILKKLKKFLSTPR